MSQVPFQFKFDLSESESHQSPLSHSQGALKDTTKEQKHLFQLIKDVPEGLSARSQQALDYDTIDLTSNHESSLPPLFRIRASPMVIDNPGSVDILQDIESRNTDLVPRVYEGGLKVWEGSIDLCRYLAIHWQEILPSGGKVLELGCGHGLPGCLLLREGLRRDKDISVMFTDYNDFVLRGVALSNIVLNTRTLALIENLNSHEAVTERIVMGAGDWIGMSEQLMSGVLQQEHSSLPINGRFDVILAAETTYTSESAKDTAILLARHMVLGSGVGLVACKRYYFGVGGGSDAFREAASSQRIICATDGQSSKDYRLSIETVQVYDNGAGNIRELLLVKCVPSV
jgi:predicted nicotinamide N-methyase